MDLHTYKAKQLFTPKKTEPNTDTCNSLEEGEQN